MKPITLDKKSLACSPIVFLWCLAAFGADGGAVRREEPIMVARVQYYGGDYYTDPTALPNLVDFATKKTGSAWKTVDGSISLLDPNLSRYPVLYLTGHGDIQLKADEISALRGYLELGGFLLVNDNGPARSGNSIDAAFRREIERVLPGRPLVEFPKDHPIFSGLFDFPEGIPQIHRHDETQPPRAFGIYVDGRLGVFYDWNSDIGNGWEDPQVHNDPEEKRQEALKMGTNILLYAMLQ
jgi:hypothetical protein